MTVSAVCTSISPRPGAWAVEPGAAAVLAELARHGCGLGLCSNFDHRLRAVLAGLPELHAIQWVVISSEVGWRKPAAAFYEAVAQSAQLAPEQILVAGDDRANDYCGVRRAGMHAVLFDPRKSQRAHGDMCIMSLTELVGIIQQDRVQATPS